MWLAGVAAGVAMTLGTTQWLPYLNWAAAKPSGANACAEAGLSVLCADAEGDNLYSAAINLPAVLVLGFGPVGRALAVRLAALGARVTVAARRPVQRAMAEELGTKCATKSGLMLGPERPFQGRTGAGARMLGRRVGRPAGGRVARARVH